MMRRLIPYLKNYKKESFFGPLFKLLEACFELIVPLIMASIIDVGIQNSDQGYILKMGGILILLGILGLISALTAQYFAAKAAFGFGTELRRDMFAHINKLSYTELDKLGTASLITRITGDINQAQSGVNLFLRLFMRSPFIVVGALIMAFTVNTELAWIFAIAIPILALVIYLIMATSMPIYKKAQKQLDKISLITRENINGIRVIRAFSRQKDEGEQFQETSKHLEKFQILAGKISTLMNPLTYVLINLAIIIIVWQGAGKVYSGAITQGEVIALVNYMTQILLALLALANLIVTFSRATASAARVNEVFDLKPSMDDQGTTWQSPSANSPKLAMENVSFAYNDSKEPTLENISFSVKSGETIGIIGGTGSGKSTLIHLIARFYDADSGSILLDGVDIKSYPFKQLRDKISIVPQKAMLFRGTIRDNMKWRKNDATDAEILHALEIAQASDIIMQKGGLDATIAQGGKNLSGGQKQRLTIARALVGKPEILILDDSSSALDYATDSHLRRALASETDNMTVFIISQRASSIRHADQILVLDDGTLAGTGTHESLLNDCQVYREICLSQLSDEEVRP